MLNSECYQVPGEHWLGASQGKYQIETKINKEFEESKDKQIILVEKSLKSLPPFLNDERLIKATNEIIKN